MDREECDRIIRETIVFSRGTLADVHKEYPDREYELTGEGLWMAVVGSRDAMELSARYYTKSSGYDGLVEATEMDMREMLPGYFMGEIHGKTIRRVR